MKTLSVSQFFSEDELAAELVKIAWRKIPQEAFPPFGARREAIAEAAAEQVYLLKEALDKCGAESESIAADAEA